jgi:hypothetical protein
LKKNDLQEKVASSVSKEYMDQSNYFISFMMNMLDSSIKVLNLGYFLGQGANQFSK